MKKMAMQSIDVQYLVNDELQTEVLKIRDSDENQIKFKDGLLIIRNNTAQSPYNIFFPLDKVVRVKVTKEE